MTHSAQTVSPHHTLWLALSLSLAAAVSLGVTRFAYGLLLPTMRADLGWTYALAGAMNTANALGYLLGALATPWLMKRLGTNQMLVGGALLASVFMALSGFFTEAVPLLAQRLLAGVASAFVFITGGLLAARLAASEPARGGLLLGLYYGGTGFGIIAAAILVPAVLQAAQAHPHAWAWAWWALALTCVVATSVLAWTARALREAIKASASAAPPPNADSAVNVSTPGATGSQPSSGKTTPQASGASAVGKVFLWRDFYFALAGYGLFGVGYIGYMTFVIALLREQGASGAAITWFYALLGCAVVLSSRIWAGLLDRYKGGQALASLNALLGAATVLPALTQSFAVVIVSGLLFGGVFLSVVASTTALVRHNLSQSAWASGISAFTVVFAAGQIVGPTIVGFIADGPGGLARGLVFSAVALWLGAGLAWRQRAV